MVKENINFIREFSLWNKRLLRLIVIFFKLIGLAPFNIIILPVCSNKNRLMEINFVKSILGLIYNYFLSIYFFLIMCLYLPNLYDQNIWNISKIQISYEIGLSFFANSGAMIIILIYNYNQEILIMVFNRLVHLETILINEFNNSHQVQQSLSGKCHQTITIGIYIIINIVLLISELIRYNAHQIFYVVRLALPGFFIGSMIIQYTLIVIFIKNKFYYLNELLLSSENPMKQRKVNSNVNNIRASLENKLLNEFKIIRKTQRALYEVSWDLVEFYSLPTLLAIAIAFIQLVYHCYFFVSPLLKFSNLPPAVIIINDIMWIMKDVFPIVILTTTISQFIIEVCINY